MQAGLLCKPAGSLLSKGFLVVANKVRGIVKVFDVILSISFRSIPGPAYEVFNGQALTFLDCAFIKKAINFKGFVFVSVTLYKH